MANVSINSDSFFIEYDPNTGSDGKIILFNYKEIPVEKEVGSLIKRVISGESYTISKEFCIRVFEVINAITDKHFDVPTINDRFKNRAINNYFERVKDIDGSFLYKDSFHFDIIIAKPPHVLFLEFLKDWSKLSGRYLHKGSALFWAGEWYLAYGDFDVAFTHFAEAIDEDKIIEEGYRNRAAYKLMSLCEGNNHANDFIKKYSNKLNEILNEYRTTFFSSLTRKKIACWALFIAFEKSL